MNTCASVIRCTCDERQGIQCKQEIRGCINDFDYWKLVYHVNRHLNEERSIIQERSSPSKGSNYVGVWLPADFNEHPKELLMISDDYRKWAGITFQRRNVNTSFYSGFSTRIWWDRNGSLIDFNQKDNNRTNKTPCVGLMFNFVGGQVEEVKEVIWTFTFVKCCIFIDLKVKRETIRTWAANVFYRKICNSRQVEYVETINHPQIEWHWRKGRTIGNNLQSSIPPFSIVKQVHRQEENFDENSQ